MSRLRRKVDIYPLYDAWPDVAVVRCPDCDRETFDRLAAEYLSMDGIDGYRIAEPAWRWYRMNPCRDDDYAWTLGRPAGPGSGNWMGAIVRLDESVPDPREADQP